ncbi:alpha-tocopherol transfer protein-like [Photinus pyralis]|uniref:alpha-tocopherol transfer protein-like n=1 Tax=Photinus pyralis TaxID=7054 RepID=UPI001267299C|nr:alpha-tocopherol transfer protein-like [Photinus pyralis]XP_031358814.1 alpha-tocopherol transfer protein-like [Photinus pyralis]
MPFVYADVEKVYEKTEGLKREDVRHLREWMGKQPHLPQVTDLDIIFFLHSCYYSIERAKISIENYYTCLTASREVFGRKDPEEFRKCLQEAAYIPLPKLTPEGYQVLFCQILVSDPNSFSFNNHIKYVDGCMKSWFLERGPGEGVVIILNMDGFVLGHLLRIPLFSIKKLMFYFQDALPVRLKSVHVINTMPLIEKVLAVVKPFMTAELIKIVYFHTSNLETLDKFVPRALLPSDHGGDQKSVMELHEENFQRIVDKPEFFEIEESRGTDESKRMDKFANKHATFGIEGSFRSLEID